jgi:hypothetical protein
MEDWFVPAHMKQLANKSTQFFGYDQQGHINYEFNNLGFRTDNAVGHSTINLIGNSISFGIGLHYHQTFGSILSTNLNRKLNNLSFGCYFHENHDHITNIKKLANQDSDDIYIIQINNLDRQRIDPTLVISGNDQSFCKKRFLDYFDQVTELLKNKITFFLYWDDIYYDFSPSIINQILIFNKGHLDISLLNNKNTFGIKTNRFISNSIISKLNLTQLT